MKHLNKLIGVLMGLVVAGYGVIVMVTQEISTESNSWRVGWSLHGTPAILNGALIFILGSYIIYLTIKLKE